MENPFDENKIQRPTLLMVVCVLTFIGSGWGVMSNLFGLFTSGMMGGDMNIEKYSSVMGELETQGMASLVDSLMESLQASFVHAREIALCGIALCVVNLVGAILMFRLRRFGFYLYTAAQILLLCVTPYFTGFSILTWMQLLLSAIVSTVFVVLYAVNLKYMR